MFFFKNDCDILQECGSLKNDIICLCMEFKETLLKQLEDNLDFIKDQEASFVGKFLNK